MTETSAGAEGVKQSRIAGLSPEEAASLRRKHGVWTRIEEVFRELDVDKSGTVDIGEFSRALEHHGITVDQSTLQMYFDNMDVDKDSKISFKEFYLATAQFLERDATLDTKALLSSWVQLSNKPLPPSISSKLGASKLEYLLAGGVAGTISRTATAPIERIKVLMQVQGIKQFAPAGQPNVQYSGILGSLRTIYVQEGWYGYFKGNGTNVVRVAPATAIRFLTFEVFKAQILKTASKTKLDNMQNLMAGAGAGLVSTIATYPLDLVRSRLSVQTLEAKYKGAFDCLITTGKEEGLRGLFRGVNTSIYGAVPYVAINFMLYEAMKEKFSGPDGKMATPVGLACGGVSGSVAMTLTYPFELIRRRLMVQGMDHADKYKGTWDAVSKIMKAEGWRGLYRGLWPNYFKAIPSLALNFWVYEGCKRMLNLK